MEFDYTITTTKLFDEAVQDAQNEIAKAGMRVLYVHDVQKLLGEKGFKENRLKLLNLQRKFANEFLDKDMKLGLCLPC